MRTENVARLFDEHAQQLFAFLTYRVGDRATAEDLVADTFERVMRNHKRFDPKRGTEKQWIYTIALNLARDHARRGVVQQRATESVAAQLPLSQDSPIDTFETRDELRAALETLSEAEREVIALRYGADLTLKEVAQAVGDGESAVEGRVYRALAKLRERLGD